MEREVAGIRCGEVLERLSDYVDGELDAPTRAKVEAHVLGCELCERFGGRFAAVIQRLRRVLGRPAQTDAGVADRLAQRLARGA